jgi:hypothetical protein
LLPLALFEFGPGKLETHWIHVDWSRLWWCETLPEADFLLHANEMRKIAKCREDQC